MILETQQEKDAFKFVLNLASDATDRICNDLTNEQCKLFKGLTVDCDDNGVIIQKDIVYDFDVVYWLQKQIKEEK